RPAGGPAAEAPADLARRSRYRSGGWPSPRAGLVHSAPAEAPRATGRPPAPRGEQGEPMRVRVAAVAAVAGAGCLGYALPAPAKDSEAAKAFKKSFVETNNSWERRALIERLDPSDDDSLELITEFVLAQQDWYMREAAIQVLAGAYDPGLISKLERMCGSRGNPMIVEGICMAFGRSGNKDRVPFLIEQLSSKKWVVQR